MNGRLATGRHGLQQRLLRAVIGCLLLGSSVLAAGVAPAGTVAALAPRLGLVAQTPYSVTADGVVSFVVSVPTSIDLATFPEAVLVVTAYRPVATRADVAKAQVGDLPRSVDSVDQPVAALVRPAPDQLTADITLETDTRTAPALQLAQPGLYPVLLELQDGGTVLAELFTFVHRLPTADDPQVAPLPVAIAMAVSSPVVLDDDDVVVIDESVMLEFGRLADILEASTMPVAVRVPPALLAAVGERGEEGAALAARVVAGLQRNSVLSAPRLPLDPSQAAAAGQQALYTQWLRDGEDDLTAAIATPSLRSNVMMSEPLSADGAALLRDLGARLVVTTPSIFDPLPGSTGGFTDSSKLVHLEVAPGVDISATIVDRDFTTVLERRTTTPVATGIYAVTHLLAYRQEIADGSLESDGADGNPARRGVTLGTGDLSLPQVDTYRAVTALLAETPGLQPTTLDTLGVRTEQLVLPGRGEVTVGLPAQVAGSITDRIAVVDDLSARVASTGSMLPADDERLDRWQELIDRLPTSALTDQQVRGQSNDMIEELDEIRAAVTVPESFSFALTGRTTTVPIKLYNNSETPLTVRVHMSSSKLIFPNGDLIEVLPPLSYKEVPVEIEARTNGRFPVTLTVLTPAGDELAPPVTLTASVNALTGLGNLVTGAFLLLVLTWWVRHVRLTRRSRAAAAASARHPVRNGNGGDADPDNCTALSPDAETSTLPPS